MIQEVKDFKRKELFNHYHSCDNPFIICTTKIDVTNIVNYCKTHRNFYATIGFIIAKTVNQIEEFKYRYENGKIYYCDIIKSNYTQMREDGTIGYFVIPHNENLNEYINSFLKTQKEFKESSDLLLENDLDEIYLSCVPWFSFTSLIPPFSKEKPIPQFIWDKYEEIDGQYYLNLMIMVHHGFADGFHVGKFIESLRKNINLFNK